MIRQNGHDPRGRMEVDHGREWRDTAVDMVGFDRTVPTLDMFVTLLVERDRNRAVQRNDIRDMERLSVTLPDADVIVIDRSWAALARRAGLDVTYRTTILTDTRDLPATLAGLGCLGTGEANNAADPSA